MTSETFISTLRIQVCNGAVEAVLAALATPSGKQPSQRDVELSHWYIAQTSPVQGLVREIIEEAVEQAVFNVLAILDGVAPIGSGNSRLELFGVEGSGRALLNDPSCEELHRLFARSHRSSMNPARTAGSSVQAYESGTFSELRNRQLMGDLLHLHRVPTKFEASQTIDGYDAEGAPAMALPQGEHRRVESA
jgi:hypothetical protein